MSAHENRATMGAMLLRTEKDMAHFARQIANSRWRIAQRRARGKGHTPYAISYAPHAIVIALAGELGVGKTTFVRAFAKTIGIRARITSPTFILARRHRIPKSSVIGHRLLVRHLWHLDVYRLKRGADLAAIDFHEMVSESQNIVIIEWADKIRSSVPKQALWIRLQHHTKGRKVFVSKP